MKLKTILSSLGILLLLIQFIQPNKNLGTTDPTHSISAVVSLPENINAILEQSCYDCHSNTTHYPWYGYVQPVAWWLNDHIEEGKQELNFSEFATYNLKRQLKKLKSIAENVREDEMPLPSYLVIHKSSSLTTEQKQALVNWTLESTIALNGIPSQENKSENEEAEQH